MTAGFHSALAFRFSAGGGAPPVVLHASRLYLGVAAALKYIVKVPGGRAMPFVRDNPPVSVGQKQTIAIDFGQFLPAGVTLIGTPDEDVTVYAFSPEDDVEPGDIVAAGPQVGTAPIGIGGTGLTDTAILLEIECPTAGVIYDIRLSCGRSDGADTVVGTIRQPVVA